MQNTKIRFSFCYICTLIYKMRRIFLDICSHALISVVLAVFAVSCVHGLDYDAEFMSAGNNVNVHDTRKPVAERRNVLLLYSAGYNSLSNFLESDIRDIEKGHLPGEGRNEDVLLIYSHLPKKFGDYSTPSAPVLFRMYRDELGNCIKDTLVVYGDDARSATARQLNDVLSYVKHNFPAKTYGMIFSSHATGYLPAGYYASSGDYTYDVLSFRRYGWRDSSPRPVPYVEVWQDPSLPAVKSIGQDNVGPSGSRVSYEIELPDFAGALPMYLDYVLFDACLMGGVEVAYELKDKCGVVGFSQTEVLAEGFDYMRLTTHLLSEEPDPAAVCRDFYEQYASKTGDQQSATISCIDCSALQPLGDVCAELFEKYRAGIGDVSPSRVQRYYRGSYHWFYDLRSIMRNAGASDDDLDALDSAIEGCMLYKAATPSFMNSFEINEYSGFSMYLPCNGSSELDKFYRTLAWNVRTGLVE